MRRNWKQRRSERSGALSGQTVVFFALASLVLMGMLGLALDAGYDFAQRRTMQNAADAAAMAGAKQIAAKKTSGIRTIVDTVASQNGVTDTSLLNCVYIKNDYQTTKSTYGDCTQAPTSDVSGVQVSARETHGTFVMRVLGIATSGTGATAAAQVQVFSSIDNGQAPFLPCGVDTELDGTISLPVPPPNSPPNTPNQTLSELSLLVYDANGNAYINEQAYSYDWKALHDPNTGMPPLLTGQLEAGQPSTASLYGYNNYVDPVFAIHGPNRIQTCGIGSNSWKGDNLDTGLTSIPTNGPPGVTIPAGTGTRSGPVRNVPGIGGCKTNQSDNCIMILPIVDQGQSNGHNATVNARVFAAFYVTDVGSGHSGNAHDGQLIKNYPIFGPGSNVYTNSYTGPVTINFIR
jgi:Flp pilus assembly protein TadG